eukprot:165876-Pyramimonas_sp.AAC.1
MRTLPLGPSVQLPMWPRTLRGMCRNAREPHAIPAIGTLGGAPLKASRTVATNTNVVGLPPPRTHDPDLGD